jgi:hypothetical protein
MRDACDAARVGFGRTGSAPQLVRVRRMRVEFLAALI